VQSEHPHQRLTCGSLRVLAHRQWDELFVVGDYRRWLCICHRSSSCGANPGFSTFMEPVAGPTRRCGPSRRCQASEKVSSRRSTDRATAPGGSTSSIVFATLLAACVDESRSLPDASRPDVGDKVPSLDATVSYLPSDYCDERIQNEVARNTECFGGLESDWARIVDELGVRDTCMGDVHPRPGIRSFDAAVAKSCVESWRTAPCDRWYSYLFVPSWRLLHCEGVVTGMTGEGSACPGGDFDCVSGECDLCGPTCTEPTTVSVATLGEDCSRAECAAGLVCRLRTRECDQVVAEGETCWRDGDQTNCPYSAYCADGTCMNRPRLGESCEDGLAPGCSPAGHCAGGLCSRWQALGDSCGASGLLCHPAFHCNNGRCSQGPGLADVCTSTVAAPCRLYDCDEPGRCGLLECRDGRCAFTRPSC
jgi:hypothetical protein